MKILIIGGTGTVSTAVVRLLSEQGHEVSVINRGTRNAVLPDGVADLLAALRTAQDDFNAANDTATAALTAKGESAYALKKPLLAAINEKLVPYVTAMSAIQPEYADFAAKADVEISKANASVGKKAKE